ncbi:MAG: succinate--CoA ligase subunit alpha [Betaproteobacteria bacterium]|nr:succinate--CoA ligase subunit alpha [Betaproteobacteria bacterium]
MIDPRITRSTPVIMQGVTGRAGRSHFQLMRAYGTNIVAGVSPRAAGTQIDGVPLFGTCAEAVAATGAKVSILFVGAEQLLAAIEEAIAAGIEMLVTPTEGMPIHDALRAKRLTLAKGVTWIGASTPGMAVPGEAKLGFLPDTTLAPGPLGIMSKSGTLSYESGYRLVQHGIGQSVWVGVGGDPVKGVRFADLVPFFGADAQTEAVLIIGEIGGTEEEEFAHALEAHGFSKPAFALIAGRSAPEGVSMGHAGALVHGAHGTYAAKKTALEAAGATVFGSLDEMTRGIVAALRR